MWVLWSKIYFTRNSFWKSYEVKAERGGFQLMQILGLLGMYLLWCCGSICHQLLTFIQIGSGHTVRYWLFQCWFSILATNFWFCYLSGFAKLIVDFPDRIIDFGTLWPVRFLVFARWKFELQKIRSKVLQVRLNLRHSLSLKPFLFLINFAFQAIFRKVRLISCFDFDYSK